MTRIEYRLHAFDLASKFGFADGNMFGALLREKFGKLAPDKHEVLIECVKRYLLPALPRKLRTVVAKSGHNPILIKSDETIDDLEDITVGVAEADVLKVASEFRARSIR